VQRGRPRADLCVDACSQDQAGVLCQGGGGGEKDREGEREDEGREGRTGEREGLISSSLSHETIGEELSPVLERSKSSWNEGEKKFGDERLGLYRHWRAPILCHLVKIGSSGYNKSVSPFGGLHAAWWKHSPPFHPPNFCFF